VTAETPRLAVAPCPITLDFVRRMAGGGAFITAVFTVVFVATGAPWQATSVVATGSVLYFALYRKAGSRLGSFFLLALSWLLIGILDEGFGAGSAAWVFLIPVTMAGWILHARSRLRWVVLAMPLLLVALTNIAQEPVLHVPVPPMPARVHLGLHFLGAFLASIFCVQHMLSMERDARDALESARTRAEKASRAKDDFLSHMSHEFRTPLNAINGFTEILLAQTAATGPASVDGGRSREDSLENLGAIRSATEHLVHIVEDILDLSRLESGEIRLNVQSFAPNQILSDVRTSLLGKAAEKNLAIRFEPAADLPRLMGDRVRWKQILLNLVGNAIKFSNAGEIRLSTRWLPESETRGRLEVRVADQGSGIAPELEERIFERFVRAEAVERAGTAGTGLGLAISRSLARAMGGDVALEANSSRGSTFLVAIPFGAAEPDDPGSGTYTRIARLSLKDRKVLLCEDNRLNIRLATKLLDRLEASYDVAEDGGKAMEALTARAYDLVLLDLHMPVADGFEVARFLRGPGRPPGNEGVPILALTADAFEETRHKAKAAGMDDFLAKPYSFEDLATKAMRLLDLRARSR